MKFSMYKLDNLNTSLACEDALRDMEMCIDNYNKSQHKAFYQGAHCIMSERAERKYNQIKERAKELSRQEALEEEQATNKVIAYVRVSDISKQDSSTQRHAIADYAKANKLVITEWREFHISGSKANTKERGIDDLVRDLDTGDKVLITDIDRLGRDNVKQLTSVLMNLTSKCELHLCYSGKVYTPQDTDLMGVLEMVIKAVQAVEFAEARSKKSKAACKRRTEAGLTNGRQKGTQVKSKFDKYAPLIMKMLEEGQPKTAILAHLKTEHNLSAGRTAFYKWIDAKLGGKGINKDYHSNKQ